MSSAGLMTALTLIGITYVMLRFDPKAEVDHYIDIYFTVALAVAILWDILFLCKI